MYFKDKTYGKHEKQGFWNSFQGPKLQLRSGKEVGLKWVADKHSEPLSNYFSHWDTLVGICSSWPDPAPIQTHSSSIEISCQQIGPVLFSKSKSCW